MGVGAGGGASEVLPLRKGGGGGEKVSQVEGGHKKVVFDWGEQNVIPCLEVGAQMVSDRRFSHFVAYPPRDQSLTTSSYLMKVILNNIFNSVPFSTFKLSQDDNHVNDENLQGGNMDIYTILR